MLPNPLIYVWICFEPLCSTISFIVSSISSICELKSPLLNYSGASESAVTFDKVESAIESNSSSVCFAFKSELKLIYSGIVISGDSNFLGGLSSLDMRERRHIDSVYFDFSCGRGWQTRKEERSLSSVLITAFSKISVKAEWRLFLKELERIFSIYLANIWYLTTISSTYENLDIFFSRRIRLSGT